MAKLAMSGLFLLAIVLNGCSNPEPRSLASNQNDIELPKEVTGEPDAWEVVRIWKTKGGQLVLISPKDKWNAEEWGIMLTDLARHVAKSKNLRSGENEDAFLGKLKESFDKEWTRPTDLPKGRLGN